MAKKPARLGRGLNSLISSSLIEETQSPPATDDPNVAESEPPHRISIAEEPAPSGSSRIISQLAKVQARQQEESSTSQTSSQTGLQAGAHQLVDLPVESITPNANQPRKAFDAISIGRLARSIAESGVLQPLLVRPCQTSAGDEGAKYELIAGERRWRAAKAAGMSEIPVIIKPVETNASMEMALVENIQREDLNAIDRARAYDAYCKRTGMGPDEAGRKLGEDRTTITNYLRLLELPHSVVKLVETGKVSMGHARALLGCQNETDQVALADQTAAQGLSVRAVEKLVRAQKTATKATATNTPVRPNLPGHLSDLEEKLQQAAKTKVKIQPGRGPHRGKIIIDYYTLDDFDRIAAMLGYSDKDAR